MTESILNFETWRIVFSLLTSIMRDNKMFHWWKVAIVSKGSVFASFFKILSRFHTFKFLSMSQQKNHFDQNSYQKKNEMIEEPDRIHPFVRKRQCDFFNTHRNQTVLLSMLLFFLGKRKSKSFIVFFCQTVLRMKICNERIPSVQSWVTALLSVELIVSSNRFYSLVFCGTWVYQITFISHFVHHEESSSKDRILKSIYSQKKSLYGKEKFHSELIIRGFTRSWMRGIELIYLL